MEILFQEIYAVHGLLQLVLQGNFQKNTNNINKLLKIMNRNLQICLKIFHSYKRNFMLCFSKDKNQPNFLCSPTQSQSQLNIKSSKQIQKNLKQFILITLNSCYYIHMIGLISGINTPQFQQFSYQLKFILLQLIQSQSSQSSSSNRSKNHVIISKIALLLMAINIKNGNYITASQQFYLAITHILISYRLLQNQHNRNLKVRHKSKVKRTDKKNNTFHSYNSRLHEKSINSINQLCSSKQKNCMNVSIKTYGNNNKAGQKNDAISSQMKNYESKKFNLLSLVLIGMINHQRILILSDQFDSLDVGYEIIVGLDKQMKANKTHWSKHIRPQYQIHHFLSLKKSQQLHSTFIPYISNCQYIKQLLVQTTKYKNNYYKNNTSLYKLQYRIKMKQQQYLMPKYKNNNRGVGVGVGIERGNESGKRKCVYNSRLCYENRIDCRSIWKEKDCVESGQYRNKDTNRTVKNSHCSQLQTNSNNIKYTITLNSIKSTNKLQKTIKSKDTLNSIKSTNKLQKTIKSKDTSATPIPTPLSSKKQIKICKHPSIDMNQNGFNAAELVQQFVKNQDNKQNGNDHIYDIKQEYEKQNLKMKYQINLNKRQNKKQVNVYGASTCGYFIGNSRINGNYNRKSGNKLSNSFRFTNKSQINNYQHNKSIKNTNSSSFNNLIIKKQLSQLKNKKYITNRLKTTQFQQQQQEKPHKIFEKCRYSSYSNKFMLKNQNINTNKHDEDLSDNQNFTNVFIKILIKNKARLCLNVLIQKYQLSRKRKKIRNYQHEMLELDLNKNIANLVLNNRMFAVGSAPICIKPHRVQKNKFGNSQNLMKSSRKLIDKKQQCWKNNGLINQKQIQESQKKSKQIIVQMLKKTTCIQEKKQAKIKKSIKYFDQSSLVSFNHSIF